MNSPIIFDVIFLCIVLFMFLYGKRKGAVKVVTGLMGTLIAWVLASSLAPTVTPLTVKLVTPYATGIVERAAESTGLTGVLDTAVTIKKDVSQAASALLSVGDRLEAMGMPGQTWDVAEKVGVTGTLEGMIDDTEGTLTPIQLLTSALVAKIAPTATFVLLFIAIKIAIALLTRLLSLNWPLLGALNHLAGGLMGLVGGLVIAAALCVGILTFGSDDPTGLTSSYMMSQSIIGGAMAGLLGK